MDTAVLTSYGRVMLYVLVSTGRVKKRDIRAVAHALFPQ